MPAIPRYIEIPVAFDDDMEVSSISLSISCQEIEGKSCQRSHIPSRWDTSDQEGQSYGIPHKPTRYMSDCSPKSPVPLRIPHTPFHHQGEDEESLDEDLGRDRWCAVPRARRHTIHSFTHTRCVAHQANEDDTASDEDSPRGVEDYPGQLHHVDNCLHIERKMSRIGRRWRADPFAKFSDADSAGPESYSKGSIDTSAVGQSSAPPAA